VGDGEFGADVSASGDRCRRTRSVDHAALLAEKKLRDPNSVQKLLGILGRGAMDGIETKPGGGTAGLISV
jgi:hypothetical protein